MMATTLSWRLVVVALVLLGLPNFSTCETICSYCFRDMSVRGYIGAPSQLIVTAPTSGSSYYTGINYKMIINSKFYVKGYYVTFRTIDCQRDHSIRIERQGRVLCEQSGLNYLKNTESTAYTCKVDYDSFEIEWITDPRHTGINGYAPGKGFELTITAFENPSFIDKCSANEFRCHYNGQSTCIDKLLTCNGRNNCGSLEDEKNCKVSGRRTGAIIGAVIGTIAVIAFISGLVLFIRRRRTLIATTVTRTVVPTQQQPMYVPPPVPQPYPVPHQNYPYQQPQYPAANQYAPYTQPPPYPGPPGNEQFKAPYP